MDVWAFLIYMFLCSGARGQKGVCGEFGRGGVIFSFVAEIPTKIGKRRNPTKKKHVTKFFTGLSRDFPGTLFMCFFSPMRNDWH